MRAAGLRLQGKEAAVAPQPEGSFGILGQGLAVQGAGRLRPGDGNKTFPPQHGRPRRGDRPELVVMVFVAEPDRSGGQAGVGLKGPAVITQQSGGGAHPEPPGTVFQQVVDGITLELGSDFARVGHELHAIKAHQAAVGTQPEVAIAGLGDRVYGVLRQSGIGAPGLVTVVVQGALRLECPRRVRDQQQQNPHTPSLPGRPHHPVLFIPLSGSSMNRRKSREQKKAP